MEPPETGPTRSPTRARARTRWRCSSRGATATPREKTAPPSACTPSRPTAPAGPLPPKDPPTSPSKGDAEAFPRHAHRTRVDDWSRWKGRPPRRTFIGGPACVDVDEATKTDIVPSLASHTSSRPPRGAWHPNAPRVEVASRGRRRLVVPRQDHQASPDPLRSWVGTTFCGSRENGVLGVCNGRRRLPGGA